MKKNKIRLLIEPLKLGGLINMSREEIIEKLSEDLKSMLHYMDCCFDEYTLINQDKTLEVKRCYEEYTLEVLS